MSENNIYQSGDFVILGEDANRRFSSNIGTVTFKYLLVKEQDESATWKMLLFIRDEPYSLHAQALRAYMDYKKLESIIVHGGGLITFLQMTMVHVFGFSFAFRSARKDEVFSFLQRALANSKSINADDVDDPNEEDIHAHRVWNYSEVDKEAKKKER